MWHVWGREETNIYFKGTPEVKRSPARPSRRWEENIKIDVEGNQCWMDKNFQRNFRDSISGIACNGFERTWKVSPQSAFWRLFCHRISGVQVYCWRLLVMNLCHFDTILNQFSLCRISLRLGYVCASMWHPEPLQRVSLLRSIVGLISYAGECVSYYVWCPVTLPGNLAL